MWHLNQVQRTIPRRNDHSKSYNIAPGRKLVGDIPAILNQAIFRREKYDSSLRPDSFLVKNLCTNSSLSIRYL